MEQRIYSVTQLTRRIKELLESSFPRLWIEGELSNAKLHSSGHFYCTLKDQTAQISCAMWRSRVGRLSFRPENGLKVLVEADLQVYERGGNYQLIIQSIHPAGVGALQLAFEQLKKRLHGEGLFDPTRKRPLPRHPERVGIITSPTGAAVRDMISVFRRRFPGLELVLCPVRVQGDGAAEEIADAIEAMNRVDGIEVIVVGRGGGSLEDLWAFNEERVARAIAASAIPVVSAVGHEVDYTIADFVADLRAPTPSAAAELVVRDRSELAGEVAYLRERTEQVLLQRFATHRDRVSAIADSYAFRRPQDLLYQRMQQLDEYERRLAGHLSHRLELSRSRLDAAEQRLQAANPTSLLRKGYALCMKDGLPVRSIDQLHVGDDVTITLHDGDAGATVTTIGNRS